MAATDADPEDTLTYSLEGADAARFTIDTSTGQLRAKVGARYNYEDAPRYSVTVRVADEFQDVTIPVTLNVGDVGEPALEPGAPMVEREDDTSMRVSWTPPDNTGRPMIIEYQVRRRVRGVMEWEPPPYTTVPASETEAIVTGLRVAVYYEFQVRALNEEGGLWSVPVAGRTRAPAPAPLGAVLGRAGAGVRPRTRTGIRRRRRRWSPWRAVRRGGRPRPGRSGRPATWITFGSPCRGPGCWWWRRRGGRIPSGRCGRGRLHWPGPTMGGCGRTPAGGGRSGRAGGGGGERGGRPGAYTLETRLLGGYLENPGAGSFQSGIGVVSGWVCGADTVEIELNGVPQEAAYGTERRDTQDVCGDTATGFGLLFNWNRLGDGTHEVVAYVDGIEFSRASVTVTTLGAEFLRAGPGECVAQDFPSPGETGRLVWQEASQSFVLAAGAAPTGAQQAGRAGVGYLENPSPNSYQSGIGVISGWVCEAGEVVITLGDLAPQGAGYGTERLDTAEVCGDTDNGFGLLFNWNRLGEGEHPVVAVVDGVELGRATVRVTTLGEEFVRDAAGMCTVTDFPTVGETVTLEWQQSQQNFVMIPVE